MNEKHSELWWQQSSQRLRDAVEKLELELAAAQSEVAALRKQAEMDTIRVKEMQAAGGQAESEVARLYGENLELASHLAAERTGVARLRSLVEWHRSANGETGKALVESNAELARLRAIVAELCQLHGCTDELVVTWCKRDAVEVARLRDVLAEIERYSIGMTADYIRAELGRYYET